MTDDIKIRSAVSDDVAAIAQVRAQAIGAVDTAFYKQSVLDEWAGPAAERVERLLSNAADVRIVAELDGALVGYGELVTKNSLLGACYVDPSAGGRGVGTAIVEELERIARAVGLRHLRLESSVNAERFYLHCGYRGLDRARYATRSGDIMDCVVMEKVLG